MPAINVATEMIVRGEAIAGMARSYNRSSSVEEATVKLPALSPTPLPHAGEGK